jgi:DNA-3-methyladenine glycosylase II
MKLPVEKLIELDNRFEKIIDKFGVIDLDKRYAPFDELVKAIIYQQLSGKAATTIYKRFLGIYKNNHPTTLELMNTEHQKLRNVGLSNRKAEYIKSIAEFFNINPYNLVEFSNMRNEEIYNKLIGIRGVGPWTIDMFLMFTLHRLDIFPSLDLGVQKGFSIFYNSKKLCTPKFMLKEAKKWAPYRSIASHYFWKIADEK